MMFKLLMLLILLYQTQLSAAQRLYDSGLGVLFPDTNSACLDSLAKKLASAPYFVSIELVSITQAGVHQNPLAVGDTYHCEFIAPNQDGGTNGGQTNVIVRIPCATGEIYNFSTQQCEIPTCPAGEQYNPLTQQCEVQKNRGECEGESCCLGNPIHGATGNKYQIETDITLTSLLFSRTYNSTDLQLNGASVPTVFGSHWNHNFERYVIVDMQNPNAAHVIRPDGKSYLFTVSGIQWTPDADIEDQLEQLSDGQGVPTGWRYTTIENTVEDYDVSGKLISITDLRSNLQTLIYDTSNRLDRVDTNTGESLQFGYDTSDRISTTTDQAGRIWTYRYDANNNLEYVDNSDGTTKQYHYNETVFTGSSLPHALTGITDERGIRYATYEYQADGRAIATYHASNVQRVDITYNDTNGTRTVTNSLGQPSTYSTATQLGMALVTDVSGPGCTTCGTGNTGYNYDPANNNLLSRTENGITTKFDNYDSKGQFGCKVEGITSADISTGVCAFDPVASPDARRIDYTYDSRFFNKIVTMVEPSVFAGQNKTTTNVYDAFGNKASETISGFDPVGSPVSRTTTWQYNDPLNQLSFMDGPRTGINDDTTYRYYPNDPIEGNNRARLKEIEDATGALLRSNIQYTGTGKIQSETRPNGLSLSYTYYPGNDRLATLTETGTSGSRVTQWTYLATGEVESITISFGTSNATTLTFGYDDARRLTRITDGLGNHIDYSLDTEGNRLSETTYDANGTPSNTADDIIKKQLSQTFDIYNRLDTSSQANEARDLNFAPDGTLDLETDGNNVVADYSYDALQRLTQVIQDQSGTDPTTANASTQYDYDVADRLTAVTDPINGNTTYLYDDLGNLVSQTSPDTGTTTYLYDAAGNLTQKTDANGQVFVYTYDALNRLTGLNAPGTDDDITYTYDSCLNGSGRLCRVSYGPGFLNGSAVHYQYNGFGDRIGHQGLLYGYDSAGRVATIDYPSGATLAYFYEAAGNINQVDYTVGGQTQTLVSALAYAPFGPMTTATYGNGKSLTTTLDNAYRITGINIPGVLERTTPPMTVTAT